MDIQSILIRTALALLIGGLIGHEREINNRPAGFRTHTLVCLGAAVIAMIQIQLTHDTVEFIRCNPNMADTVKINTGRIVAQVVSGIGFLGAGTIMFVKNNVRGLTTAATLWVVGCIGIAIGFGYYEISIVSGSAVLLVLLGLKNLEKKLRKHSNYAYLQVEFISKTDALKSILNYFEKERIHIREIIKPRQVEDTEEETENLVIDFKLYCRYYKSWDKISEEINSIDVVQRVKRIK